MDKLIFRFSNVAQKSFHSGILRLVKCGPLLLLILSLSTGCGVYSWSAKSRARAHYKKASKLASEQDYKEAAKEYEAALEEDRELFEAYYDLGVVCAKQRMYEHAIRQYMLAAVLRPGDSECRASLARAYAQLGEYEAAVKQLKYAIELGDDSQQTEIDLGLAYEKLREFDAAILHYRKAIRSDLGDVTAETNRANARAHWSIGNIYYAQKEYEKAKDAYYKAIDADPDYVDAYFNLGVLYEKNLDNRRLAVSNYKKYLELGGAHSRVYAWVDQLTQQIEDIREPAPPPSDGQKLEKKGDQSTVPGAGRADKSGTGRDESKRIDAAPGDENKNVE